MAVKRKGTLARAESAVWRALSDFEKKAVTGMMLSAPAKKTKKAVKKAAKKAVKTIRKTTKKTKRKTSKR